jgi:hypothetical protein
MEKTPINPSIQNVPSTALDFDDDEVQAFGKSSYIDNLLERSLARSFEETNVASSIIYVETGVEEQNDVSTRAKKRVIMILDQRQKVEQLTELFIDEVAKKTKTVVDSPAVNKMLDRFME